MPTPDPILAVNAILAKHGLPLYGSPGTGRLLTAEQAQLMRDIFKQIGAQGGRLSYLELYNHQHGRVGIGQQIDGVIRIGGVPGSIEERYASVADFAAAYGLK